MKLAQLSLYYLVGYLAFGGIGLVAAPDLALRLLLSTGSYGDILPRLCGMLMLALATLVLQITRHNIHSLYETAIALRILLCCGIAWLYARSHDPLFLMLLGIVGLGVLLTVIGYGLDKRRAARAERPA